jgi:hypothetical protein
MPAIAALSKVSMHSCRCGYRAHGALLQVRRYRTSGMTELFPDGFALQSQQPCYDGNT